MLGLSGRPRPFARRAASRRQESSGPSIGPHVLRGVLGRFTVRGRSALFTNECLGFHPAGIIGELARSIINARRPGALREIGRDDKKEAHVGLLLALVLLLVLIGIIGGVAITKFLFFALVVAALVALIGFFARTA